MPKHIKVTSPGDGRPRLVSKRVADALVRRGWTKEIEEPARTAPRPPKRQYQTRHMEAAPAPVEFVETPKPQESHDPFEGVDFASDVAYEVARDAGLGRFAFEGRTGSGKDGAFTKLDVLTIVEDWA